MAQQKTKIEISKEYSTIQRLAISEEILDVIMKRTKQGKDINNKKWSGKAGKYSDSYANSKDFKIGGKSKGNINLTLSNDMLDALDLLKQKPGELTLGYDAGSDENARAEGNIKGTYGQKRPIPGKARNFLGISEKDLNKILKRFPINPTKKADVQRVVESAAASELTKKAKSELEYATEYLEQITKKKTKPVTFITPFLKPIRVDDGSN